MADATDAASHFEFGRNWADFAERLSDRELDQAQRSFARLLPPEEVAGKTVLDLGCGSGLHSLAALRLGAARVEAVDIDSVSVETTSSVLSRFATGRDWTVSVASVFEFEAEERYDIVYSWGVLHHTGDMKRAIRIAAQLVKPGGLLCIALYRRTPLCTLWKVEKRLYTASPHWLRRVLEATYRLAYRCSFYVRRRDFAQHVRDYASQRGMSFDTDVRDWLGGYPYESISEADVRATLDRLGFEPVRTFCSPPGVGLLGTGCDEYVFRRRAK
jgi:2-polyprenyl-3-methyl-5-hydroxy-6-metoxy-1,4-benzoquinol methylase